MIASKAIGNDANKFFKNMAMGNRNGKYDCFLVVPNHVKSDILKMIDEEIAKGRDGQIRFKMHSITDLDIMEHLKQASCAGAK